MHQHRCRFTVFIVLNLGRPTYADTGTPLLFLFSFLGGRLSSSAFPRVLVRFWLYFILLCHDREWEMRVKIVVKDGKPTGYTIGTPIDILKRLPPSFRHDACHLSPSAVSWWHSLFFFFTAGASARENLFFKLWERQVSIVGLLLAVLLRWFLLIRSRVLSLPLVVESSFSLFFWVSHFFTSIVGLTASLNRQNHSCATSPYTLRLFSLRGYFIIKMQPWLLELLHLPWIFFFSFFFLQREKATVGTNDEGDSECRVLRPPSLTMLN